VTAASNLTDLGTFLGGQLTLEAATVARPARGSQTPEARAMSLAGSAEQFFRGIVEKQVTSNLNTVGGAPWTLKPLNAVYKPDLGEVEWEQTAAIPEVVYATTQLSNISALAPFDPGDEKFKKRLRYWAVVLTDANGKQAFFFRKFTEQAELKRKRGAALINRTGSFTRVDDEIFLFDDDLDCFVFEGFVYVLRKLDYRRIFDQISTVLAKAKIAARELHQQVPIANFAEFEQACSSDSRLADKLLSLRGRDYFSQLSYAMLKPVISQFKLSIPTKDLNGQIQLVFEPGPAGRFKILKLVDDDYLRSSMTGHGYESNSKSQTT
jgi:hypothetical protein